MSDGLIFVGLVLVFLGGIVTGYGMCARDLARKDHP
jgi:hypothetical protein